MCRCGVERFPRILIPISFPLEFLMCRCGVERYFPPSFSKYLPNKFLMCRCGVERLEKLPLPNSFFYVPNVPLWSWKIWREPFRSWSKLSVPNVPLWSWKMRVKILGTFLSPSFLMCRCGVERYTITNPNTYSFIETVPNVPLWSWKTASFYFCFTKNWSS